LRKERRSLQDVENAQEVCAEGGQATNIILAVKTNVDGVAESFGSKEEDIVVDLA